MHDLSLNVAKVNPDPVAQVIPTPWSVGRLIPIDPIGYPQVFSHKPRINLSFALTFDMIICATIYHSMELLTTETGMTVELTRFSCP